jgi:hypothetical protein
MVRDTTVLPNPDLSRVECGGLKVFGLGCWDSFSGVGVCGVARSGGLPGSTGWFLVFLLGWMDSCWLGRFASGQRQGDRPGCPAGAAALRGSAAGEPFHSGDCTSGRRRRGNDRARRIRGVCARPRHRCDRNADRPHQLISVSRRPSQLFVLPQPCRNVWHGVRVSGGECCSEAEKFMHWT